MGITYVESADPGVLIGRKDDLRADPPIRSILIDIVPPKVGPKEHSVYRMFVNKNHPPPTRFATVAHELADLFLGHLGADAKLGIPDRVPPTRALQELEAESVAYLVWRNGVTSRSHSYLANFVSKHTTIGDLQIYRVMRAAGRIEALLGLAARTTFA